MLPPHVQGYVQARVAQGKPAPRILASLTRSAKDLRPYDLLYRVSDDIWVHILEGAQFPHYETLEPPLDDKVRALVETVRNAVFEEVAGQALPVAQAEYRARLSARMAALLQEQGVHGALRQAVTYHTLKQIVGAKHLEPLIRDPWIEDIHAMGTSALWPVHKVFGACRSNILFPDVRQIDAFLGDLAEGMGRPVSQSRPIVDGALADGSRINIVYGEGVSVGGSSFTIRKFSDVPTAVTQLIAWGTFDTTLGAYLWLCMENGMSVFVSGETASGKTTTLNGLLPFVPKDAKI
ncbi:MAG: ATPase, T2SS/T4P/T4SS family [Thermoplasmatota archaeon]